MNKIPKHNSLNNPPFAFHRSPKKHKIICVELTFLIEELFSLGLFEMFSSGAATFNFPFTYCPGGFLNLFTSTQGACYLKNSPACHLRGPMDGSTTPGART